jgi:hypothetical protein
MLFLGENTVISNSRRVFFGRAKMIVDELKALLVRYVRIEKEIRSKIEKSPEGALKVDVRKDADEVHIQYHRRKKGEKTGKYLRKGNEKLIKALAQKDYMLKAQKVLEKEIKALERFLKIFDPDLLKKVYENLPQGKKELVVPYQFPDKEYAKKWQAMPYEGKVFRDGDPGIYTKRGERVRSKSEQLIADRLFYSGIPYRYEYPFELKNGKKVYTDFTILNVRTRTEYRLEHFGMMGDPEYRGFAFFKIADYANNGLLMGRNIIYTFEDGNNPLDSRYLDLLIRKFFL